MTALLLAASAMFWRSSVDAACLSYETNGATIEGLVESKLFPGPPNYESVDLGDRPERYWIMRLDAEVCVDQPMGPDEINFAVAGVREVQLGLSAEQYSQFELLIGKRGRAVGKLMGAHTGHHKTPVLLWVTSLVAIGPKGAPANQPLQTDERRSAPSEAPRP